MQNGGGGDSTFVAMTAVIVARRRLLPSKNFPPCLFNLQVAMKAGGANAMFVAMTAVISARRRLKRQHAMDVMLVPAWITEDTVSTLGRESKFLRFNIIKCVWVCLTWVS